MSGLLPSSPDVAREHDPEPRVIGLDSDDASDLIAALSSETARHVLSTLHEEPSTPSTVADQVDTSLQNAQYHLEKLEAAELIEEVDTCYSAKGREMSVYAPTNGPLVVFHGSDDDALGLQQALKRVVGAVAILGILSLLVEAIARQALPGLEAGPASGGPNALDAESMPPASDPHWLVDAVLTAPPGLLVFLGGCVVLAVGVGIWYWRHSGVRVPSVTG